MTNNQARFFLRILATPLSVLAWLAALLLALQAIAGGDFKQATVSLLVSLLALFLRSSHSKAKFCAGCISSSRGANDHRQPSALRIKN